MVRVHRTEEGGANQAIEIASGTKQVVWSENLTVMPLCGDYVVSRYVDPGCISLEAGFTTAPRPVSRSTRASGASPVAA